MILLIDGHGDWLNAVMVYSIRLVACLLEVGEEEVCRTRQTEAVTDWE
jgi:hypothetical protein